MILLILLFLFLFGLFLGSFLNVVADRSVRGEDFIKSRSKCENCNKILGILDLIPVASFIFAKGKCKYCGTSLSWYYPLTGLFAGLMMVVIFWIGYSNTSLKLTDVIFIFVLFCVYFVLFLTDMKHFLIPNKVVNFGIFVAVVYRVYLLADKYLCGLSLCVGGVDVYKNFIQDLRLTLISLGFAILIGLFFWAIYYFSKGTAMGGGDIPLVFLIGLAHLYPYNLLAVFLGFLLGAVFGVVLILIGKAKFKTAVPFGPFLVFGSVLVFLWGPQLLGWYLGLMGF